MSHALFRSLLEGQRGLLDIAELRTAMGSLLVCFTADSTKHVVGVGIDGENYGLTPAART